MHSAVLGIRTGRDGGRIGRPHGRRRIRIGQQLRVGGGLINDLLFRAVKANLSQKGKIRSRLRRQYALLHTHRMQPVHLGQTLQGGRFG